MIGAFDDVQLCPASEVVAHGAQQFQFGQFVPRPLKERIGLTVSTLRRMRQPIRRPSVVASNCGVDRKTGSITDAARSIASREIKLSG